MPTNSLFLVRHATVADAASIATVHVKAWQESYRGIIDQSVLDDLSVEQRFQKRLSILNAAVGGHFVACVAGKIIGFCDTGPSRTDLAKGEVYAIYVLDAFKGMGAGYHLFSAAVSYLHAEGLCPFIIWALTKNKRARAFYERQGGKICTIGGEFTTAGKAYPEVCYRFK